jgi:hypothetical protein
MEEEYFVNIKGFETYSVSNFGNVKDNRTGKLITQYLNLSAGGYYHLNLRNPSGYCGKSVHRLVGENLIPNPENLPEIDHIDRNRKNNCCSNLRWVSKSDNQINKLYSPTTNSPYKCIHFENLNTPKSPYSSWRIIIKNKKLFFSKRYKTDIYTLEEVKKIRDELFAKNDMPIND